jgi:hypothetical protein
MPRKQNGFGKAKSLAFKPSKGVHQAKAKGAAGYYPSNRRYGTSVHRSVIESYNLDSDWVKWRKGYEYYNRAAWYKLETYNPLTEEYEETKIQSKLYQGTDYEIDVEFTGYKFATKNSDSNNHYVMKRETLSNVNLGTITSVQNDELKYPEQKANREILVSGTGATDSRLLLQMIGERLTDGETEASLNYVLNNKLHPGLYIGKSPVDEPVEIKATLKKGTLDADIQDYVGKIIYVKQFYREKPIGDVTSIEFIDDASTFDVAIEDELIGVPVDILDPGDSILPPSLLDIGNLDVLASTTADSVSIKGVYRYDKSLYQRFFGQQYLTAQVVEQEIVGVSYTVMPFKILGISETIGFDQTVEIVAVPFLGEFKLYTDISNATLSFADWSFTKTDVDEYDGDYYHPQGAPGSKKWMRINTDIDPWMDEVFTSGDPLKPATLYTCSCPNHAQAILRAPQETDDEDTRRNNRQLRYPLPTVMGQNDYQGSALQQAAGRIESWESREHRMGFKMCKHSIAAMFIDKIKVKEPSEYPSLDAREVFEDKLSKEMNEVGDRFNSSYRRGGITSLEVVFALAQGLNLDDVELAYVILNSNF